MKESEFIKATDSIRNKMEKWGNKIVVGQYTGKKEEVREEGEIWEDDEGRRWQMKDGIKRRLSPLQGAKTPWWCPKCEKTMTDMDTKAWRVHNKCLDCVSKEETKLKIEGKWEDHVKERHLRNQIAYMEERLVELAYYHDTLKDIEIQHFDHDTGKILMVDKYTLPVEKVTADLRKEVVAINKALKEKEAELEEILASKEKDEDGED